MSNELSFDNCICDAPGFCPLFNKIMTDNPPNWQWCQNCSIEDRKKYYITNKTKHSYIESLLNIEENIDLSRFEIAVLGHSEKQYLNIKPKIYLKFLMLQNLDLNPYNYLQNNTFSESRAYVCKNLFNYNNIDYVGTVTASWNYKYLYKLEELHNLQLIKKLIKYNIRDTIICANAQKLNFWKNGFLTNMGFDEDKVHSFIAQYIGHNINFNSNKILPLSNQIICHKDIFIKLSNFMLKFMLTLNDYAKIYNLSNKSQTSNRSLGYICEYMSMVWFEKQDYFIYPIAEMNNEWYNIDKINKRDKENIYI